MEKLKGVLFVVFALFLSQAIYVNTSLSQCMIFTDTGGSAGPYEGYQEYTCTICAPTGETISYTFTEFQLEDSSTPGFNCKDYMQIFDGPDKNSTQITDNTDSNNQFCEDNDVTFSPQDFTPTGNCVTFYFDSDGSFQKSGWVAEISSPSGTCSVAAGLCTVTTFPAPTTTPEPTTTLEPTTTSVPTTTAVPESNVLALIDDGFKGVAIVDGFFAPQWDESTITEFVVNHNDVDSDSSISDGDQFSFSADGKYVGCTKNKCMLGASEEFFTLSIINSDGDYYYGTLQKGNLRYVSFVESRFGFSAKSDATIFKLHLG